MADDLQHSFQTKIERIDAERQYESRMNLLRLIIILSGWISWIITKKENKIGKAIKSLEQAKISFDHQASSSQKHNKPIIEMINKLDSKTDIILDKQHEIDNRVVEAINKEPSALTQSGVINRELITGILIGTACGAIVVSNLGGTA